MRVILSIHSALFLLLKFLFIDTKTLFEFLPVQTRKMKLLKMAKRARKAVMQKKLSIYIVFEGKASSSDSVK